MPSPFPGMDPYLESSGIWPDFHSRFMNVWCEAIADQLPDEYFAQIEERLTIHAGEEGHEILQAIPDVVISHSGVMRDPIGSATTLLEPSLEPALIPITQLDQERTTYIEIRDRRDDRVVTVLELLSPSNKSGGGLETFASKRHHVMMSDSSFVELDLLVAGMRTKLAQPWPSGRYHYLVARPRFPHQFEVYSWNLGDRLPVMPVPLRAPDADILCDLSAVFATTYQRGRYERTIKYGGSIELPLTPAEGEFVRTLAAPK